MSPMYYAPDLYDDDDDAEPEAPWPPPPGPGEAPKRNLARPNRRGDPDRYLRTTKHGAIQVRPFKDGQRFDLGCFPSIGEARKARDEFLAGRREPLPRYVRAIRSKTGVTYLAIRPRAKGEAIGMYATRAGAYRAVVRYVRREWGVLADRILSRRVKAGPATGRKKEGRPCGAGSATREPVAAST